MNNSAHIEKHQTPDRLLRLSQIIGGDNPLVPLSRSGFYAAINRGEMPSPLKIGRSSLWRERELLDTICNLAAGDTT